MACEYGMLSLCNKIALCHLWYCIFYVSIMFSLQIFVDNVALRNIDASYNPYKLNGNLSDGSLWKQVFQMMLSKLRIIVFFSLV